MILILTQCFPPKLGGIESLMGGAAAALAAAGNDVLVLADGADPAGTDAERPYRVERFTALKPLRRWMKARVARPTLLEGVDAVIADSWKSLDGPLGALAKQHAPGRVVCLAHGMEFPASPSAAKIERIRRAFVGAAVVANSRDTAARAAPYCADGAAPAAVLPPIAPQPAPDEAAAIALRDRIGGEGPLIATLARLEPRKGVDRLIEALAALSERHPTARLAVAGGGADRERLEALVAGAGLGERVTFLGRVSEAEKAALLSSADLFAMPVRVEGDSVEGFGIVYLEAAWYGTPALAGRAGGAGDAVLDGETGLLCDGAEVGSVVEALDRLLSDVDLRARLGAAAQARARDFVWEKRVGEYLKPIGL